MDNLFFIHLPNDPLGFPCSKERFHDCSSVGAICVIDIWGHNIKLDYNNKETLFIFEGMALQERKAVLRPVISYPHLQNEEAQWAFKIAPEHNTTKSNDCEVQAQITCINSGLMQKPTR